MEGKMTGWDPKTAEVSEQRGIRWPLVDDFATQASDLLHHAKVFLQIP